MDMNLENILAKLSQNQNFTKIITPSDIEKMVENSRAAEVWKANDERNNPIRNVFSVDVGNLPEEKAKQILGDVIKNHENCTPKFHSVVILLERRSYTLEEFDNMLDEVVMNTFDNFKSSNFDISKLRIEIDLNHNSIKFIVPENKEYAEFLRLKAIYDPVE
jgi:hypothetical protein